MEHQSVTVWLRQLATGDQDAAKKLWDRYGPELVELSRRRFGGVLGVLEDEEDLVQSVFKALWLGATDGRLDGVQGREHLWWLLLKITRRKALNRHAHNTRKKRSHSPISLSVPTDDGSVALGDRVADEDQPPPDLILILAEEQDRLLAVLRDDVLRSIALWKLDGHTHEEIAHKLGVTTRTVVRKFNLIRETWSQELDT